MKYVKLFLKRHMNGIALAYCIFMCLASVVEIPIENASMLSLYVGMWLMTLAWFIPDILRVKKQKGTYRDSVLERHLLRKPERKSARAVHLLLIFPAVVIAPFLNGYFLMLLYDEIHWGDPPGYLRYAAAAAYLVAGVGFSFFYSRFTNGRRDLHDDRCASCRIPNAREYVREYATRTYLKDTTITQTVHNTWVNGVFYNIALVSMLYKNSTFEDVRVEYHCRFCGQIHYNDFPDSLKCLGDGPYLVDVDGY